MVRQVISRCRLIVVMAAFVVLAACASVDTVDAPSRGVTGITNEVTPAGISFSLASMPDADTVSVHVIWPNRLQRLPAASQLGVDLMSSGGAGSRSAKKIKQTMTSLGSAASLVATPDHVYGTFTASRETLGETIAIVRDVIVEPELSAAQFDALKEAMIKRVEARQQKASARLWSVTRRALLGDSLLTDYWNNGPPQQVIAPITISDIERWLEDTFVLEGVTVVVAGNIEVAVVGQLIDELLTPLPAGSRATSEQKFNVKTGFTLLFHDESAVNTSIAVIGLLPPSREGKEVADIVAVGALGKGKESRLGKSQQPDGVSSEAELTIRTPITASIANFNRDVRVFGINAEVPGNNGKAIYSDIENTYKAYKEADLTDQEVLRAAVPFANSLRNNANKPDLIAYGLGQLLLDGLPAEKLLTVMQDSLSLRETDINDRITGHYPDWESLVRVIMTSDEELVDADCVVKSIEELSECEF